MKLSRLAVVIAQLTGFAMFAAAAGAPVHADETRKVTLAWRQVTDALKYQLEIASSAEMDPLVESKEFIAMTGQVHLKPGTYYFRVRGIDKDASPGPWSEVEGFVVNPAPPVHVIPDEGQVFKEPLQDKDVKFAWKSGIKGSKYLFEVRDKKGVLLKRNVTGTNYEWKPEQAGKYAWRVGFETPAGDEWSKYRTIEFAPSAFPKPEKAGLVVTEKILTDGKAMPTPAGIQYVDMNRMYFEQEEKVARLPEWSVLGRLGQAIIAYSGLDKDTGAQPSSSGIVGFISAEVRWRGAKAIGQKWTWSAAMNFEMIRQTVISTTFQLPRFYGRVFYGKEEGKTRIGPFLQLGYGQSGLFIVDTPTSARTESITRQSIGLGGAIIYRTSPTFSISALLLLRRDMGGTASIIPNPLKGTMSTEAGFGVWLGITRSMGLEGRVRLLQEKFAWDPAGTYSDDSYLNNTFVIMDVGLSFKF